MGLALGLIVGLLAVGQTSGAPEDALEDLHLPGYKQEEAGTSFDLEFEIAPEIVSHNPLGSNGRTSDATNLALTLIVGQPLSEHWAFEFDAGPSFRIDGDPGVSNGSGLAAGFEIRARSTFGPVRPFAGYQISRGYTGVFDDELDTIHSLTGGLRYGRSVGPIAVGLELAPRLVVSSAPISDYWALNGWGEIVVPLEGDVHLFTDVSIERRWYLDENPAILAERRDWRFEAFAGIDLADAVGGGLLSEGMLRGLGFGLRAVRVSSNLDAADQSSLQILPAVTVGISF